MAAAPILDQEILLFRYAYLKMSILNNSKIASRKTGLTPVVITH